MPLSLKQARAYHRKMYYDRKVAKVCVVCGKEPVTEFVRCRPCRAKQSAQRRLLARRRGAELWLGAYI